MRIGNQEFDESKTYVMGILNVTPDSFSDGGKWNRLDAALAHAKEMADAGAAIIDVGGESTRPGYEKISEEEEIERVVPIIEAIRQRMDVPISIDTYKAAVARAAIKAGADLVNDIWGLKYGCMPGSNSAEAALARTNAAQVCVSPMAELIAETGAACCLMHNREKCMTVNPCRLYSGEDDLYDTESGNAALTVDEYGYRDFMEDMLSDLKESVKIAGLAGISRDKIILDPGVGFAKSYEQNLMAIRHVGRLKELGLPVLLGTSRKSVIGITLGTDKDNRLEGTLATTVYAVEQGCMFVRVHDVPANIRAIRMTESIIMG